MPRRCMSRRRPRIVDVRSGGLSAARLERLHDVLGGYVERGELPGFITLIDRRGEVHVDCVGYERDTIFRLASMSKPVAGAAACILVEECAIGLDDPVSKWLPELADLRVLRSIDSPLEDTVPMHRPITLRDLLANTPGTGLVFADPGTYPIQEAMDRSGAIFGDRRQWSNEKYMQEIGSLPLVHQPGEVWMYNAGSDILGVLVARVSGQSFGQFLEDRLFGPLGMSDSGFAVPEGKVDRLPAAYTPGDDGLKLEDGAKGDAEFSRPAGFESGAGGLVGTIDDYHTFARMLLSGGAVDNTRLLARPTVEAMTADQLTAEQKARSPWLPDWWVSHGWGWGVGTVTRRYATTSTPGQYGWDGGFGTTWRTDPGEEMIAILMTQVGMINPNGPSFFRDFYTSVYAAIDD